MRIDFSKYLNYAGIMYIATLLRLGYNQSGRHLLFYFFLMDQFNMTLLNNFNYVQNYATESDYDDVPKSRGVVQNNQLLEYYTGSFIKTISLRN